MTAKEQFLSKRERYQPIALPQEFSDEEMARDWTLSEGDREEIGKHRKSSRLLIAIQLCAVRLYGRFLNGLHDLSPRIVNYLNRQLDLAPSLTIQVPEREATYHESTQLFHFTHCILLESIHVPNAYMKATTSQTHKDMGRNNRRREEKLEGRKGEAGHGSSTPNGTERMTAVTAHYSMDGTALVSWTP